MGILPLKENERYVVIFKNVKGPEEGHVVSTKTGELYDCKLFRTCKDMRKWKKENRNNVVVVTTLVKEV